MTTILIRKGLNGFRYSACGEKGNFLFNTNQIGQITANWSNERKNNTIQFIRQLNLLPEDNLGTAGTESSSIGVRMKEVRKERGYTQRETALLLDIPYRTYAGMERGKVHISKHKLMIFSIKLRANHEWLLTGKGRKLL